MGAAKHDLMRYEDERWAPTGDERLVCERCFSDEGIKGFISKHAKKVGCDFCKGSGASKRLSIEIDEVIEFIASCINREYGGPEGILPWDSEDRCYFSASEMQSLIYDHIDSKQEEVIELILSAFDDAADWVHVHALRDPLSGTMKSLWGSFSDSVKHERRFFFARSSKASAKRILRDGAERPADILTAISAALKGVGVFRYIDGGQKLVRARKFHKIDPPPFDLENFGVPSKEVSKRFANRMSPAGIPIFYGSENRKTAVAEVQYADGDSTAVATFVTHRKLLVVDLTLIPPPPSIFMESNWEYREAVFFLNQFRKEIMREVDRKGHEHVDYIPSQIFTEFIRHRVKFEKRKIDGLIFPSTHNQAHKNFAFFCDNSLILEKGKSGQGHFLRYIGPPKLVK